MEVSSKWGLIHCTVEGCNEDIHVRRLCSKHYYRFRRYGNPLANPERKKRVCKKSDSLRLCSIEGCSNPHVGKGYRRKYYDYVRYYGDPFYVSKRTKVHSVDNTSS